MKYDEYYQAREQILSIMKDDLLGPVFEDEVLTESPVSYYLLGKLYPRNVAEIDDDDQVTMEFEDVFKEEDVLAFGNGNYPSAMGITFAVSENTQSVQVYIESAYYEYDLENKNWRRIKIEKKIVFLLSELCEQKIIRIPIHDNLSLQIRLFDTRQKGNYKINVTLVNANYSSSYSYMELSKVTYFQPQIKITIPEEGKFEEVIQDVWNQLNEEDMNLDMLYSDRKKYAVGHGCSVSWIEKCKDISEINLEILPEYDLNQMKPAECIDGNVLSMKFLAEKEYLEVQKELKRFADAYIEWIQRKRAEVADLPAKYKSIAKSNLDNCYETCSRLKSGIEVLQNPMVFRAFQLANKAMLNQRMNTVKCLEEQVKWYPFQLAFIIQEIEAVVFPENTYRSVVDLLWFPTGGGKTEAYLGIAAFTIFYRRIMAIDEKRKDRGVAVIMRYTLRLLSFQQFERAAAMICAAEVIRREEKLGKSPFSIGLWAGGDLTPNRLKDAEDYLKKGESSKYANPIQLKKCPSCGRKLDKEDYHIDYRNKRLLITCPNEKCHFHEGLPVQLIDEDIYAHNPSFLIGTIDKFAQIAFNENAGELLGISLEKAPDLIIQDELHLISGPLGTVSGLYETAILKLCEKNGIRPKIIASTATIKNAADQILQLYGTDYRQFPPQGISMDDSFFADLSTKLSKPSRKYVGIFSAGSSRALTFNRVVGALLFATRYLETQGYSEEVIDSFWTETGYFNTLRELGSALIRIVDSVQDRFTYLVNTKFANKYPLADKNSRYDKFYEMTSRNSSADLGSAIQNELMIPYDKEHRNVPYDFLIASNMISVGVDVSRLNNMVVVGQPMKTAEYIQSSSRVGRSTPGMVFVLYHPSKSRDRSHYEQFIQYHSTLYKYVEATSVTPFADRARDRALQALYVILCRFMIPELRRNEDAVNFKRDMERLKDIRSYIVSHVHKIDPEEEKAVRKELDEIEMSWEEKVSRENSLVYFDYQRTVGTLFDKDYEEGSRFRMMNSMRSVETAIDVYMEE